MEHWPLSVLHRNPAGYRESEGAVASRRSHPLIERRHLALLHMAPGQHRLIKWVPLSLPFPAAKRPQQGFDGTAHLGTGDGPQPGTTAARAHLVDGLTVQAA